MMTAMCYYSMYYICVLPPGWLSMLAFLIRASGDIYLGLYSLKIMAWCLMAPSHYFNQYDFSSVRSSGIPLRAISEGIPHSSLKLAWKFLIENSIQISQGTMSGNFLIIFITLDSEVIMFSPCVFVCLFVCGCLCLSRSLSGRFNYEGLVPHKQYFAGTLLGMSSCASYVSRTHDVIDDVTRSQSRSNFEIDISPSIFELRRRSKARNVGNAHGYLSGIFNFRYNFR